jgi:hypothetical protein
MRRHFVLATAIALVGSGCIDTACTLIGCSSGLRVKFLTPPSAPYRIEATSGLPQGQVYVFECVNLSMCGADSILLTDYLPPSATIKVITAAGTTTTAVTPEYSNFQPNGSRCGPTCTSATVQVPFP